jgi:hypothetical protein
MLDQLFLPNSFFGRLVDHLDQALLRPLLHVAILLDRFELEAEEVSQEEGEVGEQASERGRGE